MDPTAKRPVKRLASLLFCAVVLALLFLPAAAQANGGETVRVRDIAGYINGSEKTVRRRLNESRCLGYKRGVVTRAKAVDGTAPDQTG